MKRAKRSRRTKRKPTLDATTKLRLWGTLYGMGYDLHIEPLSSIPQDVLNEAIRRLTWRDKQ